MPYSILEEIVSGAMSSDPGRILAQALNMFATHQYDCVVCEDIDRLARPDMEESGRILKCLMVNEITVVTPSCIYNPNNPDDLQALKNKFFFADMELHQYKRRMKSATEVIIRKESRHANGSAPLGYRWDAHLKTYMPNEDYPIIEYIFEHVWNKGTVTLANEVNQLFGLHIGDGQVAKKLHNPFYAGYTVRRQKARFGKRIFLSEEDWIWPDQPGNYVHPVTLDEWRSIQNLMAQRWNQREKPAAEYWAGSSIRCAFCGTALVGTGARYTCSG